MKQVGRHIDKDGGGYIALIPDESEDMWQLYNLINEEDIIKASTIRKIQQESATGSSTSSRVRTTVTLQVETTDFDIPASLLRVKGRNVAYNDYIKIGQYHTIDLEPNRKVTINKKEWDSISLERVDSACDPSTKADLGIIIMHEGLAHLCLITSEMTVDKAKININIPKKSRGENSQRKKAMDTFYEQITQAVVRHFNFDVLKAVVIASPGFYKDDFFEYLNKYAVRTDNKVLKTNKKKFLLTHASSGFRHCIPEVLENPDVSSKISDTKAFGEVRVLDQFMAMLASTPDRAYYGCRHVHMANDEQAIETLLISDSLLRSNEVNERKKYIKLVDSVRDNGGEVKIFSRMHLSGEQLDQISGIAAILRYPMPEIEEEDHGLE